MGMGMSVAAELPTVVRGNDDFVPNISAGAVITFVIFVIAHVNIADIIKTGLLPLRKYVSF